LTRGSFRIVSDTLVIYRVPHKNNLHRHRQTSICKYSDSKGRRRVPTLLIFTGNRIVGELPGEFILSAIAFSRLPVRVKCLFSNVIFMIVIVDVEERLFAFRDYRWSAAQRYYVHKICFRENCKDTKVVCPLCGHTTFVLSILALTMTIVDKITWSYNDVNKTSTSVEWLAINILR